MRSNYTDNEIKALQGIVDSDYRDGNHPVGCPVWSWSANPFDSARTFSGVVASLIKKKLAKSDGGTGDEACITMTQEGWLVLRENAATEKNLKISAYPTTE